MKRTALFHASAIALMTATLALAGCKKDADPLPSPTATRPATTPAPPSAPPALAATVAVTSVSVGNRVAPDGTVAAAGTTFAPTDTITASVMTQTSNPSANVAGTLAARWTFEDGQVINNDSKTLTFTGPGTTNFQISKSDGWPTGRYTLEVTLNGAVAQTTQFEIR